MKWKAARLGIQADCLRHIAIDGCRNQWEGVVSWTVQGQAQEVVFQGMIFPTQFNPCEIAIP
jgi:hypothetical protein